LVHRVVEFFRSIPAALAIPTVFLMAAGETALFLGLIVPGELAVVLGGVLASQGRVPLGGILAAAVLGPIVGDSIGYFIGRRYGRRFFARRRRKGWAKARLWLRRRGPQAVFVGRFAAFLRSIIPAAAGVARVPYRRFLPWSVAAGIVWGAGSALLGYLVGRNFETLARWVGHLSLALLALVIAGAGWFLLRRRLKSRRRARRRRTSVRTLSAAARGSRST
jgi:undecaprenyl-diphosphatase